MTDRYTFTSESVTEGHPDKMCDQISDSVLDAIFERGPAPAASRARRMATTGLVVVAGEISTKAYIDIPRVVRDTSAASATTASRTASTATPAGSSRSIDEQSPDIAMGVDKAVEQRAGDGRPLRRDRRRRPGDDVRVRLRRHRRPDADADLARAPARAPPGRGPQVRRRCRTCAPTARPRSPSSTRTAGPKRLSMRPHLHPDRPGRRHRDHAQARPPRARHPAARCPTQFADDDFDVLVQPDRQLRARRPARRLRAHRPQDHRRHLRRHGPPRRRRVQRQGPDQGRPLGRVRGAPRRQEHRRRRHRASAARSRWRTPSASPTRSRSWSRRSGRPRSTRSSSRTSCASTSTCAPRRSSRT